MRAMPVYTMVLLVALTLAGCAGTSGTAGSPTTGTSSSPSPAVAGATPIPPPTVAATPGSAPGATPTSGAPQTAADGPTSAAIKVVIQKADQEQQNAFTKNNPTLMKDTATTSYYNQLVQINSQMASGGVTAIKLIGIQWGAITLTNSTSARATDYETWQTTYKDGTTDQAKQLNVYTLIQQHGVWLIQTDNHPTSTTGSSSGSPASGPSGSTPPPSPTVTVPPPVSTPATGASTSRNWAGYAATSGTFTGVTGTWKVPRLLSAGSLGTDATWVGIGGVKSRDLIQAGTEETTVRSGITEWDAWIETLPQASRQVQFAVHPGDSVTVSINEQATNQWLIRFNNNTTGESYQTTVNYTSSRSSAEWIEEAPSAGGRGGRILPLNNFGSVQFSGGSAVENGKTVTIAQSGAQPIRLAGPGGTVLVTPSVLTSNGKGFVVTRSGTTTGP